MKWMFIILPVFFFVVVVPIFIYIMTQDYEDVISGIFWGMIFSLCLAAALITNLSAKCITTEYQKVEVQIVDEYHQVPIAISTGKTTMCMPPVYDIKVEYHGAEYTVSGSDTYYKYKDKVGEKAKGILEIRVYEDLSEKYNIVDLE